MATETSKDAIVECLLEKIESSVDWITGTSVSKQDLLYTYGELVGIVSAIRAIE